MKAETAYNVIQALDPKEKQRLYKMLNLTEGNQQQQVQQKKKPLLTDAEATEYLLKKMKKNKPVR